MQKYVQNRRVFLKKAVHVVIGCFTVAASTLVLPGSVNTLAKVRLSKKSATL